MNTLILRFRQYWFSEVSDGWHYGVFRILWSQFHFTFAIYMFYWNYKEMLLPPLPYPGVLAVFSQIPVQVVLGMSVLHLLLAICILLGWHTRFVQCVAFVSAVPLLFHSVSQYQNHYVFYLLVTLYATLMPTERFYSLDSYHRKKRTLSKTAYEAWKNAPVPLYAQRLIQLQLSFLYFFAALNKLDPIWFMRWSTTPELAVLATDPFVARFWMQLVSAGIAWIPLTVIIAVMLSLSVGIFYANRYPLIALAALMLHLSFQFVLPIMEFTPMCMSILFLSLFPIRNKVVGEVMAVARR